MNAHRELPGCFGLGSVRTHQAGRMIVTKVDPTRGPTSTHQTGRMIVTKVDPTRGPTSRRERPLVAVRKWTLRVDPQAGARDSRRCSRSACRHRRKQGKEQTPRPHRRGRCAWRHDLRQRLQPGPTQQACDGRCAWRHDLGQRLQPGPTQQACDALADGSCHRRTI